MKYSYRDILLEGVFFKIQKRGFFFLFKSKRNGKLSSVCEGSEATGD